ncbi:MAG: hypothetical protein JWM16_2220 [Verrucomicrobiales bacterium]|nr:hypothetical protein [Verrucomicrobiales bacterium]
MVVEDLKRHGYKQKCAGRFGRIPGSTSAESSVATALGFDVDLVLWSIGKAVRALLRFTGSSAVFRLVRLHRFLLLLFLIRVFLVIIVLDLIAFAAFRLFGVLGPFVAGQGTEHDVDAFANEFSGSIRMSEWRDLLDKFFDLLEAKLLVSEFTPSETQGHFHLHFLTKEIDGVLELNTKIVGVDPWAELDLLHLVGVLVLFGFFFLLGYLVAVLPEIHQPADWRCGIWGNFHQVHCASTSHINGIGQRMDTELIAVVANHADFAGANFPVDSYE